MKKLFLLAILFLVSMTIAVAGPCTEPGFQKCYEEVYSYGDATANARVFYTFIDKNGPYVSGPAVGALAVQIGHRGDRFYIGINQPNWPSCTKSGCSGWPSANDGIIQLATTGQTYTGCFAIAAQDYDAMDYWAWSWTAYGQLGTGNCNSIPVVECKANTDCLGTQFCQANKCVVKECENGLKMCNGNNQQVCENYKWVNKGIIQNECGVECTVGTKCSGTDSVVCENYKYVNKGSIVTKCGVDCISGEKCEGVTNYKCTNYKWVTENVVLGKCGAECSSGATKCEGTDYYTCESSKFVSKGKVVNQCGIQCLGTEPNTCDGLKTVKCEDNVWKNDGIIKDSCGAQCLVTSDCQKGFDCNGNVCSEHITWFQKILNWLRSWF
jgi:hypothetical protein